MENLIYLYDSSIDFMVELFIYSDKKKIELNQNLKKVIRFPISALFFVTTEN